MTRIFGLLISTIIFVIPEIGFTQGQCSYNHRESATMDGVTCWAIVSPYRGNTVFVASTASLQYRLTTVDRINSRKATVSVSGGNNPTFAVSDQGPAGFINVAYVLSGSVTDHMVHFSKDSGATFQSVMLPHNTVPSTAMAYNQLVNGSYGYANGRPTSIVFDANGRLNVFYYLKNQSANKFLFYTVRIEKDGTVGAPVLLGGDPNDTPSSPAIKPSGLGLNFPTNFIHTVATTTKVVALYRPYRPWKSSPTGTPQQDQMGAVVIDSATGNVEENVKVGIPDASDIYYRDPYTQRNRVFLSSALLTSDGVDIFLMSKRPPCSPSDPNPALQCPFTQDTYEIRRLPYVSGVGFFPQNDLSNPTDPMFNLSTDTTPRTYSWTFMTQTQANQGQGGEIINFAAPIYTFNPKHVVDVNYITPVSSGNALDPQDVIKIRFNPDVGTTGVTPLKANRMNQQMASQEIFGVPWVPGNNAYGNGQSGTSASLQSAIRGTIAGWCMWTNNQPTLASSYN